MDCRAVRRPQGIVVNPFLVLPAGIPRPNDVTNLSTRRCLHKTDSQAHKWFFDAC